MIGLIKERWNVPIEKVSLFIFFFCHFTDFELANPQIFSGTKVCWGIDLLMFISLTCRKNSRTCITEVNCRLGAAVVWVIEIIKLRNCISKKKCYNHCYFDIWEMSKLHSQNNVRDLKRKLEYKEKMFLMVQYQFQKLWGNWKLSNLNKLNEILI